MPIPPPIHEASAAAGSASVFNIFAFSSPLPEHLSRIVARDSLASTDIRHWACCHRAAMEFKQCFLGASITARLFLTALFGH